MFVFSFFHNSHSFSSFFFLLALASTFHITHAWNTHTRTHSYTQFKMNGFKLTKNSERTHLQNTHTHTLNGVYMPPSDKHRMMNTLGAVRTFLFDLIQFIRVFFHSRNAFHIHTRQHEGMTIFRFSWYLHPKKFGSISYGLVLNSNLLESI